MRRSDRERWHGIRAATATVVLCLASLVLCSSGASAATVAENAHSGAWYATTSTSDGGGGIDEDVAFASSAGQLICGSASIRTQYPSTGAAGTFAVWLIGTAAPDGGSAPYSGLGTLGNWSQLHACVEATGSHTTVRVQFYPAPGSPVVAMDDVDVHASVAVNGGFENGASPWAIFPGTSSNFTVYGGGASNPAHSGSHFGATNASSGGGGIYEDVPLSTTAGQLVCGSTWLRNEGSLTGATGTFVLWLLGGSAQDDGATGWSGLGNGANWKQFSTCVEATGPHTTLRIQFYPTPGTATTEIDDVDVHLSLAANGGFETGGAPWAPYPGLGSNFTVYSGAASDPARSGGHFGATNAAQGGGGAYEDVSLKTSPGQLVCGSAWLRTEGTATGATGTFALWLMGDAPSDGGSAVYSGLGNGTAWSPVSACVEATASHSTLRVQMYPSVGSPTVEVDDVDAHRSIAVNGGFEYGSSPWGIYPGTASTYDVLRSGQVAVPPPPPVPAPATTVVPVSHRRHALRIRLSLRWTWYLGRPVTRLDHAAVGRLPHRTRLSVSCAGRRCPLRHALAAVGSRRIHRLLAGLVGRRWFDHDRLRIAFTARGWSPERAQIVFRFGCRPVIRP